MVDARTEVTRKENRNRAEYGTGRSVGALFPEIGKVVEKEGNGDNVKKSSTGRKNLESTLAQMNEEARSRETFVTAYERSRDLRRTCT